jgi:cell wall-associated NlpC family hydrolase
VQAKQQADAAVAAEKVQAAQLQTMLANSQSALRSAQSELATLNNQRAAYEAWVKEQARLAAIRRAREEAARRAAEERARERAREQAQGGGTPVSDPGPSAPSTGHWTQAEANTALRRAESTLGTPYAWAGGNAYGPTYGVCDASNGAPNDCHVYGYDCSGLAMYAWGPYLSMAHYAATQYLQAGRYHPGAGALRPGDLIFWSFNGQVSGIHHVAIYAGGGQIIEAPYSGGYVQRASLYEYGSFFGATRPLT